MKRVIVALSSILCLVSLSSYTFCPNCTTISISKEQEPVQHGYIDLGLPSGNLWKEYDAYGKYTLKEAIDSFGKENIPTSEDYFELCKECFWEWTNQGYVIIHGPNGNVVKLKTEGQTLQDCTKYLTSTEMFGNICCAYLYAETGEKGMSLHMVASLKTAKFNVKLIRHGKSH